MSIKTYFLKITGELLIKTLLEMTPIEVYGFRERDSFSPNVFHLIENLRRHNNLGLQRSWGQGYNVDWSNLRAFFNNK